MFMKPYKRKFYRAGGAIFVALSAFFASTWVMNAIEMKMESETTRSATITVNSTADVVADDGLCTLREAITAANRDTASGLLSGECAAGSGHDTIVLSGVSYPLALAGPNEEENATGDLDFRSHVTIEVTSGMATIDGNRLDRVLHVHPDGAVSIGRVVITGGKTPDGLNGADGAAGAAGASGDHGGGLYNAGLLSMSESTIGNNRTGLGGNGGNSSTSNGGEGGSGGFGGAIYNTGTLTLTTPLIQDNRTGIGGQGGNGGNEGRGGNGGSSGHGGAIYNAASGQLTLIDSTIERNSTGNSALARRGTNGGRGGDGGYGGAIYNEGTLAMSRSAISHNRTSSGGPGGSGTNGGDGGNGGHGGALYHFGDGSLTLTDVSIDNNITGHGGQGGASQSKNGFGGNGGFGGYGGGLYYFGNGSATLHNSTIHGNITGNGADGAPPGSSGNAGDGGDAGSGGGIYQIGNGRLMIRNSLVSSNQTGNGGNADNADNGDNGDNGGNPNPSPRQGGNGGNGGGIASTNRLTMTHTTITANITGIGGNNQGANGSGGGIFGGARLKNTIVAGNQSSGNPSDCVGRVTSLGYNLLQEVTGCTISGESSSNITGEAPLFAPLADNGGSSLTHALLLGSPALDAGTCDGISTDQRGQPRPIDLPNSSNRDDGCDIGAYERQQEAFLLTKTVDHTTPHPGQPITYTISIVGFTNTNSLVLSDTLPAGLTFQGPITLDPPQTQANLTQSPKSLPTLASRVTITDGERITLTLPVTLNDNLAAGTIITNTAAAYSKQYPAQTKAHTTITVHPTITVTDVLTQTIYLPLVSLVE
ncbi:MAG: choice-of-anchor Q domain-containing protein [Ardenticatenaceae bacterium]